VTFYYDAVAKAKSNIIHDRLVISTAVMLMRAALGLAQEGEALCNHAEQY
jgi:hypothetical protein